MIRCIIKHEFSHASSGARGENFSTLDIDAPELEAALDRGGMSEHSFESYTLAGISIIRKDATETET